MIDKQLKEVSRSIMSKQQTYDNYHKAYFKTETGRQAKNRAQRRYRRKLAGLYGLGQNKASLKHQQVIKESNHEQ